MKKKAVQALPYLAISSVIMLVFALLSLGYNRVIFYIELAVAFVGIGLSIFVFLRFDNVTRITVRNVVKSTKGIDKNYLDRFGFPVAVVGEDENILWYNSAFSHKIARDVDMCSMSISELIRGYSLAELCGSGGADISVGNTKFSVYANPVDMGYVLYFFDDTYLKNTEHEYKESRLSVAYINIDNSEAFDDEDEDEEVRVVLQIESLLQRLAVDHNALYRKMGQARYMLILEERELRALRDDKFAFLKDVRAIKSGDINVTVSVGIGRGESNLRRSQSSAKKALDMALGRGGDQVAILTSGEFEFFGGKSASVERQSKVRVRAITKSFMTAVSESDKVFIMGHKFSDLDCIGSAIGLYRSIVTTLHRRAYIVVNYENSMAKGLIDIYKSNNEEEIFVSPESALELMTSKSLLIIVDTQSVSRLESTKIYDVASKIIVIDHHRMSVDHIENTLVFYHEPSASSASEMCVEIIDSLPEMTLRKQEAEALLSGMILDTKNFVINSGSRTFEAAALLRKQGADTVSVRQLFSDSIDIYRNKYRLVSTAKIYKKCAIVIAEESLPEIRLIASKAADELLGLSGVNASFVIYKTDDSVINISARSYGKRNVQLIMEKLGGGGHHAMAAAQLKDVSFETALRQLVSAIDSEQT